MSCLAYIILLSRGGGHVIQKGGGGGGRMPPFQRNPAMYRRGQLAPLLQGCSHSSYSPLTEDSGSMQPGDGCKLWRENNPQKNSGTSWDSNQRPSEY